MTTLFMQLYPSILLFILRWHKEVVTDHWPNIFFFDFDKLHFFPASEDTLLENILISSIIIYVAWLVPYCVWQLYIGMKLPNNGKNFDTVFHRNMRNGMCEIFGKYLWRREREISLEQIRRNDFELKDFFVYIILHSIGFVASLFAFAYPCSLSPYVHGPLILSTVVVCIWRGAKNYTYLSSNMHSKLVQQNVIRECDSDETKYELAF